MCRIHHLLYSKARFNAARYRGRLSLRESVLRPAYRAGSFMARIRVMLPRRWSRMSLFRPNLGGRLVWWALAAGTLGLSYGRALRLPFFFDDLDHFPYIWSHTLGEIWASSGNFPYYRPLGGTLWWATSALAGPHVAWPHHLVNLLLFGLAGLLTGRLADTLWRAADAPVNWPRRWLATTLFLLFPFSYQAVPWIGAVYHPLVTGLILGAAVCATEAQRPAAWRGWPVLGWLCIGLAPFAHENGLLAGPLTALVILAQSGWGGWRRAWLWCAPGLMAAGLWWLAPRAGYSGGGLNSAETLFQNLSFFWQGAVYPTAWLAGRWQQQGLNDLLAVWLVGGVTAAATFWLWARSRPGPALRPTVLAWLWFGLAILPSTVWLDFNYVLSAPRLLMLGSVGVAWGWTEAAWRIAARGRAARIGVGLVVLGIIAHSHYYLNSQMTQHQLLGEGVNGMTAAATAAQAQGQRALFLNAVSWMAARTPTYALAHDGVIFLPGYIAPSQLLTAQTDKSATPLLARYDDIFPDLPYYVGLIGDGPDWDELAAAPTQIFVVDYAQGGRVRPVGQVGVLGDWQGQAAQFADSAESPPTLFLLQAQLEPHDDELQLTLVWQVTTPPPLSLTPFVQALDANGALIAQVDGHPIGRTYPLGLWPAGQVAVDQRALPAAGVSRVLVGLYDGLTGARWVARAGAAGRQLPDNALSLFP